MSINLVNLKNTKPHFPVLIQEIIDNVGIGLDNKPKIYLDGTFGAGGYSSHILEKYPNVSIVAIDRDVITLEYAKIMAEKYPNRFIFELEKFENFEQVLAKHNISKIDGLLLDLGFSTLQIADSKRGFSFMRDGELSMEMGLNKTNAKDVVNKASFETLSDILYHYGDEYRAKAIARKIVEVRKIKEITTTTELADLVRKIVGWGGSKIDPATKTFQALRIYVNDELNQLQKTLNRVLPFLNINGKIMVVSFHSLEDGIVKDFFNQNGRYIKENQANKLDNLSDEKLKIITKKPILPSKEEVAINPPSSCAKLRIAEKL
jgi:16S rRNA (cytosine1402-N4)-methyltransferase